ncbi:MAG: outer membrane protein assembly factor BamD [Phycisphaeraceae bacterium]|nr:outer membrane protein assembly factor BamD [Phycisphaeraceae bacterium]
MIESTTTYLPAQSPEIPHPSRIKSAISGCDPLAGGTGELRKQASFSRSWRAPHSDLSASGLGLLKAGWKNKRGMLAVLVFALLCVFVTPSLAQERYRLTDDEWKKLTQYDPATPEGQIQEIRRALAEGKGEKAENLCSKWIKRYPNHPLLVEAWLLRGDAKVMRGNEYKALREYEYVIREFPGSEQFTTALEREYEIAKLYTAGRRRKFLNMRIISADEEAQEIYIRIQERTPGSALGEDASMTLGDHLFARADMRNAAEAYDAFILNYPRSPRRERALLRVIQANLARFKGPEFDSTGLIEANERIKQYQKEYPAAAERIGSDALLVRIDESLALKTYYNANWYRGRGEKVSAATMYRRVIKDHPQTAAAKIAMQRLSEMNQSVIDPEQGGTLVAPTTQATAAKVPATQTDATQPATQAAPANAAPVGDAKSHDASTQPEDAQ